MFACMQVCMYVIYAHVFSCAFVYVYMGACIGVIHSCVYVIHVCLRCMFECMDGSNTGMRANSACMYAYM